MSFLQKTTLFFSKFIKIIRIIIGVVFLLTGIALIVSWVSDKTSTSLLIGGIVFIILGFLIIRVKNKNQKGNSYITITENSNKSTVYNKNIVSFIDNFVVVDIETTGLNANRDEIIELAACKIIDNQIVETFSELIRPSKNITKKIQELTGITNDMLEEAPRAEDVIKDFITFVGKNVIIGHNISFDLKFINNYLLSNNMKVLKNDCIDTLQITRQLLPQLKDYKLSTITEHFNIINDSAHRALSDCKATFQCYQSLKQYSINHKIKLKAT